MSRDCHLRSAVASVDRGYLPCHHGWLRSDKLLGAARAARAGTHGGILGIGRSGWELDAPTQSSFLVNTPFVEESLSTRY